MLTTSSSLLIRLQSVQDKDAWQRFVRIYTPLILKWAGQQGLPSDDAADLVQDVMAVLVRKLPTFQYDAKLRFRNWLKTVTLNKLNDRWRRKQLPLADASLSGLADASADDAFWETEYRCEVVLRAMELMRCDFQPTTWEACRRYILGEATPDQLAAEYNISVWTIYSAKSRIIKRLRNELDGLLD
ncbi:MAG: sigma-70 family RNA polymerase sigma factor [Pirellulaceae bacterium]